MLCFWTAIFLCWGSTALAALNQDRMLLPQNRSFNAYIVVPHRASEIERFAAAELAEYINKITGVRISVIREQASLDYFGICIGLTERGASYAPARKSQYDGANGFRIKSIPNGLIIVGGDELSTLYGVYAFLEEYQGCGWFMPFELGEVVPRREGIIIPENLDVTQIPDIPIRWMGDGDWALKNRMNAAIEINGHRAGVINRWNFHTFATLVPDSRYFEDHPEYFSMTDTTRIKQRAERGQFCTSNPEVIRVVSQRLIYEMTKDPEINFIGLTANDWYNYCSCSRCDAQVIPEWKDDMHGLASGPIHIFNNEVARRVGKPYPDKYIKGGAYHGYVRYPKDPNYKPEENLALIFTPHIHYCHNHSIVDKNCPYVVDFMKDYYDWAENSKHMQIFAYECLHGWAQLPWPMVHVLKGDMPEYHRTGVEQFYTQALEGTFEAYALNYYVASKLAWNSSLDVKDLVKEFCRKMYGQAGPAMEEYFWFIENTWENNPGHVAYRTAPIPVSLMEFFTPEVVLEADRLLREAEAVNIDENSKKRIHLIRVDFDYLRLVMNYFYAISEPFEGINQNDEKALENAARKTESIGKALAPTIRKYLEENYPSALQYSWARGGVERILESHTASPNYQMSFLRNVPLTQ